MTPVTRRARGFLLAALLVPGCGDDAPKAPPPPPPPRRADPAAAATADGAPAKPAAGAPAVPASAAPPGLAPAPPPAREKLLAEIRRRPFRSEDMVPSSPTNTDPFH